MASVYLCIRRPFRPDPWAVYIVLERGTSDLFRALSNGGLLTAVLTRAVVAQVLLGLEHVHRAGYVYRDLKPENVLVRANGSICIADFGLARLLPEGARAFTNCGTGGACRMLPAASSNALYGTLVYGVK